MKKSENYGFYLPSRDADDIVDINQLSENFSTIDKELSEMIKGKGVDQIYKPDSSNPQSGKAISGALIPYVSVNDNMEWIFDGGNSKSAVSVIFTVDNQVSDLSSNPIGNSAIKGYTDSKIEEINQNITNAYNELDANINSKTVDYITEQGVGENGIYRKWNSGIAECWKRVEISNIARNIESKGLYYTPEVSLGNFPADLFIDKPYICDISLQNPEFSSLIETGGKATTKDIVGNVYLASTVSKENMYATICIYAMGYWK